MKKRDQKVEAARVNPVKYEDKSHVAYGEPKQCHELSATDCRWPIGDPKAPGFHFCGAKIEIRQTYCEPHKKLSKSS